MHRDSGLSSVDRYLEAEIGRTLSQDEFAMGRAAGYRGKQLGRAMDNIKKWQDIARYKKILEPILDLYREELPDSPKDYKDEHKILAHEIVIIEMSLAMGKIDVAQRGIEHIARIKGLVVPRQKNENEDARTRETEEALTRLARQMKSQFESASNAKAVDDDTGNP